MYTGRCGYSLGATPLGRYAQPSCGLGLFGRWSVAPLVQSPDIGALGGWASRPAHRALRVYSAAAAAAAAAVGARTDAGCASLAGPTL